MQLNTGVIHPKPTRCNTPQTDTVHLGSEERFDAISPYQGSIILESGER